MNDLTHSGSQPLTQQRESIENLRSELIAIVGEDHVKNDAATRSLFSQDIWSAGPGTVQMVVTPHSVEEVARVVAAAYAANIAVVPRGGGMSYTGSYTAETDDSISLDMAGMAEVISVDAANMTVTVQAGCTWKKLHEALSPLGLRTPFWGTMSGLGATIGGGISQLTAMLGAGHYGTASESVVAMTIILGDGRILRTGARGPEGKMPFYRHYGPDLAGIFCGDSGAFGIKAEVTMRLIRVPAHEGYASFSFKQGKDMLEAMAEMARSGIASEMCAFDPGLTKVRMQRASLSSDIKTLGAVVSKQKSLLGGLLEVGKIALAGRNFIEADDYPLHVIAEGRSAAGVAHDINQAREIARRFNGREIENTIAKVIRAQPFPAPNSILGPKAERWAPVHGITPLSQTAVIFEELQAVFSDMADDFEKHGIFTGYLFTTFLTNALVIEPVFYWPEARLAIHESLIEPDHLAKLPVLPPNPEATAVVKEARKRIIGIFQKYGCGHLQIGKTYPYRASREPAFWDLMEALKREVDPKGLVTPGALQLDGPKPRERG